MAGISWALCHGTPRSARYLHDETADRLLLLRYHVVRIRCKFLVTFPWCLPLARGCPRKGHIKAQSGRWRKRVSQPVPAPVPAPWHDHVSIVPRRALYMLSMEVPTSSLLRNAYPRCLPTAGVRRGRQLASVNWATGPGSTCTVARCVLNPVSQVAHVILYPDSKCESSVITTTPDPVLRGRERDGRSGISHAHVFGQIWKGVFKGRAQTPVVQVA